MKRRYLNLLINNSNVQMEHAKTIVNDYSKIIKINGKNISVKIVGNGNEVVVLLPGSGVMSPILDMRPLSNILKETYTVITIEPLGYGFSDDPDTERTTENIVNEIHAVINGLGYNKYNIIAHSYSALHGLFYTNKYPTEVKAFVSLDGGPPYFIDKKMLKEIQAVQKSLNDDTAIETSFKQNIINLKKFLTDEEIDLYQQITLSRAKQLSMDETKVVYQNYNNKSINTFNSTTPVLIIISSELLKRYKNLEGLHRNSLKNVQKSKIQPLDGPHVLYYKQANKIVGLFEDFIK